MGNHRQHISFLISYERIDFVSDAIIARQMEGYFLIVGDFDQISGKRFAVYFF